MNPRAGFHACNPRAGEEKMGGSLGDRSASPAKLANSRPMKDSASATRGVAPEAATRGVAPED